MITFAIAFSYQKNYQLFPVAATKVTTGFCLCISLA